MSYRYSSESAGCGFYAIAVPAIIILSIVIMFLTQNFVDDGKAVRAAEDLGYKNVQVTSKSPVLPFSECDGKTDQARFTVKGTAPDGAERELVICAGIWKGGTVRSH